MSPLFVFDLDNTLYPREVPLWRMVDARIERYVRERLGVTEAAARTLREGYVRQFGTTLKGLMRHHGVTPAEYLAFVHDVPVAQVVPPRPELAAMLAALPGRRVVLTNGSRAYAERVVEALGVAGRIDDIFGIEFMEYDAKPSPYGYAKLLRVTAVPARETLFCEDVRENLVPARRLGMFTVWVGGRDGDGPADAVIGDVCDLPAVLGPFFERCGKRAAGGDGGRRGEKRGDEA